MSPGTIAERSQRLGRSAAAFLGFSIPISVALDNILLVLIAVLWLAGGDFRKKLAQITSNPVALAAVALFGMLTVGLTYGTPPAGQGVAYLLKYVDLLLIPVFVTLFRDAQTRETGLRWFCIAMILAFVVAEIAAAGLLAGNPILARSPGNSFKVSITHGVLSAYAAFLFALLGARDTRWPQRLLFAILALVAMKNVVAIGISRTGYLVLALLALYFCFALFKKRGLAFAAVALAASFVAFYGVSERFRERVDTVFVDQGDWHAHWPSRESVTARMQWYRQGLDVVLDHPLLGVGTGAFPQALAEKAGSASSYPPNPHNEYLVIAMQTGLPGLFLLLNLWWQHWRRAIRLATPLETHLARGLVMTIAVGCLFNSFLLDHTEGLFFAWFTGLLFGGLQPEAPPEHAAPA